MTIVRANTVGSGNKDVQHKTEEFEHSHQLQGPEGDRGEERLERETRAKMRRVARYQGDFSSLEERHILYGARGTIENPVIVESVFPSRIVGCFGSAETQQHDLLWHVVHHERPTVCLECSQVFKLQVPEGEHMVHKSHGHDAHDHH
jgi:hypothetical protein